MTSPPRTSTPPDELHGGNQSLQKKRVLVKVNFSDNANPRPARHSRRGDGARVADSAMGRKARGVQVVLRRRATGEAIPETLTADGTLTADPLLFSSKEISRPASLLADRPLPTLAAPSEAVVSPEHVV